MRSERHKNERAGYLACHLRGYIAALSEEVPFGGDEATNQFFWALGNWSAYMLGVPAPAAIIKRKAIEKVENVLREYAKSQVIDTLSEDEAKTESELRVSEEMKAFENTINWLRAYLNEIPKR